MLDQILTTARTAVSDINNFLKTNAEICMDLMKRIDPQAAKSTDNESDFSNLNQLIALFDPGLKDYDPRFFMEENY
jgi:hypothetical protein